MLRNFYRIEHLVRILSDASSSVAADYQILLEYLQFKADNYYKRRNLKEMGDKLIIGMNEARAKQKTYILSRAQELKKRVDENVTILSDEYNRQRNALAKNICSALYYVEQTEKFRDRLNSGVDEKRQVQFGTEQICSILSQIKNRVIMADDDWPLVRSIVLCCDFVTLEQESGHVLQYGQLPNEHKGVLITMWHYAPDILEKFK